MCVCVYVCVCVWGGGGTHQTKLNEERCKHSEFIHWLRVKSPKICTVIYSIDQRRISCHGRNHSHARWEYL